MADLYRRAATCVDKILKGAKRADLPVEQPTKFELIVNMKTARALGVKIPQSVLVLDAALGAARAAGAEALVMFPDAVTFQGRERIAAFALQHRLPTVSGWEAYATAGNLVTYGPNLRAAWVRLASHVDRVLKGADPAMLPVELPTIVELIVNRKTANALGVKIPQSVLLRADRVIE